MRTRSWDKMVKEAQRTGRRRVQGEEYKRRRMEKELEIRGEQKSQKGMGRGNRHCT